MLQNIQYTIYKCILNVLYNIQEYNMPLTSVCQWAIAFFFFFFFFRSVDHGFDYFQRTSVFRKKIFMNLFENTIQDKLFFNMHKVLTKDFCIFIDLTKIFKNKRIKQKENIYMPCLFHFLKLPNFIFFGGGGEN